MKAEILSRKTWYVFQDCLGIKTVTFARTPTEKAQVAQFVAAWQNVRARGTDTRFYGVYAKTAYNIMRSGCTVRPFFSLRPFLISILNGWGVTPHE